MIALTEGRKAFLREAWERSPSKCFAATIADVSVGDREIGRLRPIDIQWLKDNLGIVTPEELGF